jgi:hypothetical protein
MGTGILNTHLKEPRRRRWRTVVKETISELSQTLVGGGWAIFWAFIGRLLYVTNLLRTGRRRHFFTAQTFYELGIAVGMGIIAGGLGDYIGLNDLTYAGFVSACSYLGPHFVEYAFTAWVTRSAPPKEEGNAHGPESQG